MPALPYYHVDAFTNRPFSGNPAAVCLLNDRLPDYQLQQIAAELFLPETAFLIQDTAPDHYQLRWFTPDLEMDLCGHATLAAAHVVIRELKSGCKTIRFSTMSGELWVEENMGMLWLTLPSRPGVPAVLPPEITAGIECIPDAVYLSRDYMLVYKDETTIRQMKPNQFELNKFDPGKGGIIVTAPGDEVDFVSRFFTPQASIFEDPVTGSAHCTLIPYWSQVLGRQKLIARQLSKRGGTLQCLNNGDSVTIGGDAQTVAAGHIRF